MNQGYKINRFPSRKFSGVYFHIIFTLLIYNFINCFKTEKGDKLAGIGLIRLHDEISWYGVVIYAYPHFGIFGIKEIAEWFGYKGKGHSATSFNFLNMKNIILKFVKCVLKFLNPLCINGFYIS